MNQIISTPKSKKLYSIIIALLLIVTTIIPVTAAESTSSIIENAILYVDEDNQLGYNVVHPFNADTFNIIDTTNSGISTIDVLKTTVTKSAVTATLTTDTLGTVTSISILKITTRPRVGISWKRDSIGSDYEGFKTAYIRNGADAFFLPQFTSEEEAKTYLVNEGVDGVFVTGGEDVNPFLYNEEQSPHGSGSVNNARDTSDIALIRSAISLDIPLLGVCRGEQIFNVAMGGGLIQDIPYYLGQKVLNGEIDIARVSQVISGTLPGFEAVKDTGYNRRDFSLLGAGAALGYTYDSSTDTYVTGSGCEGDGHLRVKIDGITHSGAPSYHELGNKETTGIDSSSKWLASISGGTSISLVATAHHQAVNPEKLGNGLTIVAHSSDGIVEGIEYQNNLFALGIQFHPERDALGDSSTAIKNNMDPDQDTCNKFLRALVLYASVHDGSLELTDVTGVKDSNTSVNGSQDSTNTNNSESEPEATISEDSTLTNTDVAEVAADQSSNTVETADSTSMIFYIILASFAGLTSVILLSTSRKRARSTTC